MLAPGRREQLLERGEVLEHALAASIRLVILAGRREIEADAGGQSVATPLRGGKEADAQLRLPTAPLLEYMNVPSGSGPDAATPEQPHAGVSRAVPGFHDPRRERPVVQHHQQRLDSSGQRLGRRLW